MESKPKDKKRIKKENGVRFPLAAKMMLILFVVVMVSISSLGLDTYFESISLLERNLTAMANELTIQTTNSVENFLGQYEILAKSMAVAPDVQNINENRTYVYAVDDMFDEIMKENPSIQTMYIGTEDKNMYLTPSSIQLGDDFDPTIRPWYQKAIEAGELIWTDPYIDEDSKQLVVTVAVPVSDTRNNVFGVLGIDLNLQILAEYMNGIKIGREGYPVLLSSDLMTMTHKSEDVVGKTLPVPELIEAIEGGQKGAVYYEYNDDAKVGVYKEIPNVGWYVLSTISMYETHDDAMAILFRIIIIGIVTLLAALLISWVFTKSITKNIRTVVEGMAKLKDGDLTVKTNVKSKDELLVLSNNFNQTVDSLRVLFLKVAQTSETLGESAHVLAATSQQTSASSDEVARTVEDIAKGASSQAEDAEAGAVVVKDLAEKFDDLNAGTEEMQETVNVVVESSEVGFELITDLKDKTAKNEEANASIGVVIKELTDKTNEIGGILDTISSISEQTNLLALNASIEAARAGEHGRGFAVVADEIRKLAEETAKSAEDVKVIVGNIQADSKRSVDQMNLVSGISKEQTEAVYSVNKQFEQIAQSINNISSVIDSITGTVDVLNVDKDKIVSAIENISAISEETAAASEEVSAAMEEQHSAVEEVSNSADQLNAIAAELNDEVSNFKL